MRESQVSNIEIRRITGENQEGCALRLRCTYSKASLNKDTRSSGATVLFISALCTDKIGRETFKRPALAQSNIQYHTTGRISEQAMQHGHIPRDDLQILSHVNHSLHCRTLYLIPDQEDICQQIRLLGRILENSTHVKTSTIDDTSIGNVGVHLPTTNIWWIGEPTILVLFLRDSDRYIK